MNEKNVFRFVVKDAWGITCSNDILIRDTKDDNIILNSEYKGTSTLSIDYEDILKINRILEENKEILRIKNIEEPLLLDGLMQEIYFWNKGEFNKIETCNFDKLELNECKDENTKIILKVINEISKILEKYEIKI